MKKMKNILKELLNYMHFYDLKEIKISLIKNLFAPYRFSYEDIKLRYVKLEIKFSSGLKILISISYFTPIYGINLHKL